MFEPCVFIVDDDEAVRASLSRSLRTRGFSTQAFASGQAFLDSDAVDRFEPDSALAQELSAERGQLIQQLLAALAPDHKK